MTDNNSAIPTDARARSVEPTAPPDIQFDNGGMIEPTATPTMRASSGPTSAGPTSAGPADQGAHADVPGLLQQAVGLHQSGNLDAAAAIYSEILQRLPNHPDALHLAGMVAHAKGDSATAISMISRAVSLAPAISFFANNLGNVLLDVGDLQAATDGAGRETAGESGADDGQRRGDLRRRDDG